MGGRRTHPHCVMSWHRSCGELVSHHWSLSAASCQKSSFTANLPVKLIKGLVLLMENFWLVCVDQCKQKPCAENRRWWLQWLYRYGNVQLPMLQSAAVVSPCLPSLLLRFNPLKALQPKRRLQQILASSPAPPPETASGAGPAAATRVAVAAPVCAPPA